jgi:spore maturation protein CgeB
MTDFKTIKLLHICNNDRFTSYQRRLAFQELGVDYDIIFSGILMHAYPFYKKLYRAITKRLGFFPEGNHENKKIKRAIKVKKYDIIFIEKGLSIRPGTLKYIKFSHPPCKIISYSLDDMMNPGNSSRFYRLGLKYYDYIFTNKEYNVNELKEMGAKNVFYIRNAFSPIIHRPIEVSQEEKEYFGADVSFIGHYEKERAIEIIKLAEKGIKIKIWGWGEDTLKTGIAHPNIINTNKHVYEDEYAKVICSSKINLCFLRKINRDKETTRSIEIPACGGFMLGERTKEHLELFEEGKEAEFFDSFEELYQKTLYFLNHENERKQIAQGGLNRCLRSKYDYNQQLSNIINLALDHKISQ